MKIILLADVKKLYLCREDLITIWAECPKETFVSRKKWNTASQKQHMNSIWDAKQLGK